MSDTSKLKKQVERGNNPAPFMLAMMLSCFKDFIDIIFVALKSLLTLSAFGIAIALPLVVITWTISFALAITIYLVLRGQGWFKRLKNRIFYGFFAIIIGSLPLISILPISSVIIYCKWLGVKKRARKAEEKLRSVNRMTEQELKEAEREVFST